MKIIGKRIYLRELTTDDARQEYCDWLNDAKVNQYLITKNSTLEELKEYIQKQIDNPSSLFVGVFDKKNDQHIGNMKLDHIVGQKRKAELGILIGAKNYWRKGFGTEAMKLIINYSYTSLMLDYIEVAVFPENKVALRVFKKVGFKIKKMIKNGFSYKGKLTDKIIMEKKRASLFG